VEALSDKGIEKTLLRRANPLNALGTPASKADVPGVVTAHITNSKLKSASAW